MTLKKVTKRQNISTILKSAQADFFYLKFINFVADCNTDGEISQTIKD